MAHTPKLARKDPAIGRKKPQLWHGFGADWATGALGPRSPSYQRFAAWSRPSIDITRARPKPSSIAIAVSKSSSCGSACAPGTKRASSNELGTMSPTPTSPGKIRSRYGIQSGARNASGPGRTTTSQIVGCESASTFAMVMHQRHPAQPCRGRNKSAC